MALNKNCDKCGEQISIRKMPHGKWVAFEKSTGASHECKKKKKNKININQNNNSEIKNKNDIPLPNKKELHKEINLKEEIEELERFKNFKDNENYETQNFISKNLETEKKNISKLKWVIMIFFGYLLLYWINNIN